MLALLKGDVSDAFRLHPVLSYRYEATHWHVGATAGGIALPEAPDRSSITAPG